MKPPGCWSYQQDTRPSVTFAGIQLLRAIAANAVLAAHLTMIELKYAQGQAVLPNWVSYSGIAGVNLFFVISGFVMALVSRNVTWKNFMVARIIRIYPVYWFYSSIVLAVYLLRPEIVNQAFAHPPSVLQSYLLWPQDVDPLLGVGWTLIHEIYFYIVMAVLMAFALPMRFALPAWAAAIIVAQFVLNDLSPAVTVVTHPLTLQFILGVAIGMWALNYNARYGRTILVSGVALLVAGWIIYVRGVTAFDDHWARVLCLGLPCVPIVYGVVAMEMSLRLPNPLRSHTSRATNWISLAWLLIMKLGDASYSTYLSHVLTLSLLGRVFALQPYHNVAVECMFVVLCLIAANTVGLISFAWLEKPTLHLLRGKWRALQQPA